MMSLPLPANKAKVVAKMKKESKSKEDSVVAAPPEPSPCPNIDQRAMVFKQYALEGLPHEALPFAEVEYKGNHSYTVPVQGIVTRH